MKIVNETTKVLTALLMENDERLMKHRRNVREALQNFNQVATEKDQLLCARRAEIKNILAIVILQDGEETEEERREIEDRVKQMIADKDYAGKSGEMLK